MNNKSKPSLLIDFDGNIFNSPKSVCDVYNLLYKNNKDFIPADHSKLKKYDMSDLCPLCDDILSLFETKLFFEFLEPFPNAIEVIKKLTEILDITIVSIGTPENIKLKIDSVYQWFGKSVKFVPIISFDRKCKMEKGTINSNYALTLDDSISCLNSYYDSNVLGHGGIATCHNIIFGEEHEWNSEIDNIHKFNRCRNWTEVYSYITRLTRGSDGLAEEIENHNIIAKFHNDIVVLK